DHIRPQFAQRLDDQALAPRPVALVVPEVEGDQGDLGRGLVGARGGAGRGRAGGQRKGRCQGEKAHEGRESGGVHAGPWSSRGIAGARLSRRGCRCDVDSGDAARREPVAAASAASFPPPPPAKARGGLPLTPPRTVTTPSQPPPAFAGGGAKPGARG